MSEFYARQHEKTMKQLLTLKAGNPEHKIQIDNLSGKLAEIESSARSTGGDELKNFIWEKGSWGVF